MDKKKLFGFLGLFSLVALSVFVMPISNTNDNAELSLNWASAAPTATTKMLTVQIENSDGDNLLSPSYTATAQNRIVDSGENIDTIAITYLLDKSYATTSDEALDNSRFNITITNPSASVVYNGLIYDGCTGMTYSQATDGGDSWACYLEVELEGGSYALSTGTWDIDIRYDIYI